MSDVKLYAMPQTGYAVNNEDLAGWLKSLSDDVRDGEHGEVRQLLVLVESGGVVYTLLAGGPCDIARAVGLLQIAQKSVVEGESHD